VSTNKPTKVTLSNLRSAIETLEFRASYHRALGELEAEGHVLAARANVVSALEQLTQDDRLPCPFAPRCRAVKPTRRARAAHVAQAHGAKDALEVIRASAEKEARS
jgi:hypothetical protein